MVRGVAANGDSGTLKKDVLPCQRHRPLSNGNSCKQVYTAASRGGAVPSSMCMCFFFIFVVISPLRDSCV